MTEPSFDRGQILLAALVFVALLLFAEGLRVLWISYRGRESRRRAARLERLSAEARKAQASVMRDRGERGNSPTAKRLQRLIDQAGLRLEVRQLVPGCIAAAALAALLVPIVFGLSVLAASAVGLAAGLAPWLVIVWLRRRRLDRIARQLPEAIDFIVRGLRSGQAFTSALMMCGEEMAEPIGAELRLTHDAIAFGASLEQALGHLGERVPLTDLRYLIVAVLIQRESGGNLTEVLQNLSRLIRDRYKLESKVKVLSADGRLSAAILMLAPFALGAVMHMSNPEFMSTLWTDPMGLVIVRTLVVLMVIGYFILRKITRIRV